MISKDKVSEIFCSIDDFCLVFEPVLEKRQLFTGKKVRKRKFTISASEIVMINQKNTIDYNFVVYLITKLFLYRIILVLLHFIILNSWAFPINRAPFSLLY